jgi:hypothetical protein
VFKQTYHDYGGECVAQSETANGLPHVPPEQLVFVQVLDPQARIDEHSRAVQRYLQLILPAVYATGRGISA